MSTQGLRNEIEISITKELKLFIRSIAASYRYISGQEQYDLIRKANMLELIDTEAIAHLASRFEAAQEKSRLILTKQEVFDLYMMIDMVCRSFLCEIGDDYKAIAMKVNKVNEERYNQVRSTELFIAQALLEQFRKDFMVDPDFEELVERLALLD
jgi:hypothetical protein